MIEWGDLYRQHSAPRTVYIRDTGAFSDVSVLVRGSLFRCHRYVLAQSSDFFFRLFTQPRQPPATPRNPPQPSAADVVVPCDVSGSAGGLTVDGSPDADTKPVVSRTAPVSLPLHSGDRNSEGIQASEFGAVREQQSSSSDAERKPASSSPEDDVRLTQLRARNDDTDSASADEAASDQEAICTGNLSPATEELRGLLKPDAADSASEEDEELLLKARRSGDRTCASWDPLARATPADSLQRRQRDLPEKSGEPAGPKTSSQTTRREDAAAAGTRVSRDATSSTTSTTNTLTTTSSSSRDRGVVITSSLQNNNNPDKPNNDESKLTPAACGAPSSETDTSSGHEGLTSSGHEGLTSYVRHEDTKRRGVSEVKGVTQTSCFLRSGGEASFEEEGSGQQTLVRLDFLTADTFRSVLDAVYLAKDPVTPSNVTRLHQAARRLQIPSLLQHCEVVVSDLVRRRRLDAGDVLLDPEMAQSLAATQAALDVLLTDFGPDSSKTDWFLALSPDRLLSVLDDQRLNVRQEDEVYRALKDWYARDPQSRERHVARALTRIRLANLSRRTLVEEILLHPAMVLLMRCQAEEGEGGERNSREGGSDVNLLGLAQRALAYHLLPDRRHDEMLRCAQFRPSQAFERVLLVLGDQSDKLYAFSFARRAWFKLTPPPQGLGLGVAACTHGDDLYVSGGDAAPTRFWRYRPCSNAWKRLKDMAVGRRSHCQVAVNSNIYVLGGKDDKQNFKRDTLDSIEVLNLEDKGQGWSMVTGAQLPVPVRSMAAAVVGECIYLFGGRTNGFQVTVDVIQCFNAVTQQCTLVGHLPFPSCLGRALVAGKALYILDPGGSILRVRPQNLSTRNHETTEILSHAHPGGNSTARFINDNKVAQRGGGEAASEVAQNLNLADLQNSEEERNCGGGDDGVGVGVDSAEPAVWEVGRVLNLMWKWFGLARNHEGTLYVVAGELGLPPAASGPKLRVVIDDGDDNNSSEDDNVDGCGCGDDGAVFNGQAQFIRPENMSMCYVTCCTCIPKAFLVEKLA